MSDRIKIVNATYGDVERRYFDLMLTDPPWGAGTQNKGTPYEFNDDPADMPRIIDLVSKQATWCCVSLIACDDRFMPEWHIALRKNRLETATIVVESALGNPGKRKWPIKHYYYVVAHHDEYPPYFNAEALPLEERRAKLGAGEVKRCAGVLRGTISNTDPERVRGFQAQKPLWLMRAFIEAFTEASTKPDATVFDPFTGTGSTAVAAALTSRRFLGYEQNPATHAVALERVHTLGAR